MKPELKSIKAPTPVQKNLAAFGTKMTRQPTFKDILVQFYEKRGITFAKFPIVNNKEVDLQRLLSVVVSRGGPDSITHNRAWKRVWEEMGLPSTNTSGSTTIRQIYEKYLKMFDDETDGGTRFPKESGIDLQISQLISKDANASPDSTQSTDRKREIKADAKSSLSTWMRKKPSGASSLVIVEHKKPEVKIKPIETTP